MKRLVCAAHLPTRTRSASGSSRRVVIFVEAAVKVVELRVAAEAASSVVVAVEEVVGREATAVLMFAKGERSCANCSSGSKAKSQQ